MANLTNNSSLFISEVHREISTPPLDQKLVVYYGSFGTVHPEKFAIFIFKNELNNKYRVFKKYWDYTTLPKYDTGVFDLDRPGIQTFEISITKEDLVKILTAIESVDQYPESIENKEIIVLDGVEEKLKIDYAHVQVEYSWNALREDAESIQEVLNAIRLLG